ncbi:hypothetical protein AVEN_115866-1 [Araneus ventricosus]|uniref:Uncharacterized protein n=1 Tax=Araneus ventricosus TaxID=182803 RepID=A0A4Y2K3R8_ARAVE|nr:hypothetical protein AVEN_115866-1 [Araneus ventricosus]
MGTRLLFYNSKIICWLRLLHEGEFGSFTNLFESKNLRFRMLQMDIMHPFGFESIEKQLWRNKQNDRPISDSEIKAVLSRLFKTDQCLPPAGHVSEDVTSHA